MRNHQPSAPLKSEMPLGWVEEIDGLMQPSDIPLAPGVTPDPRLASVLIPVFQRRDQWHVLYLSLIHI